MGLSQSTATSSSSKSSYEEILPDYLKKLNQKAKDEDNSNVVIERIRSEDDVDDVTSVMAKSFALGPCPIHDWAIGPEFSLNDKNDDQTTNNNINDDRVIFLTWYMKWVFFTCINYGVVLVVKENNNDGKIHSVVCALPPETNYAADCASMLQLHVIKLIFKMKGGPSDVFGTDPNRRMELVGDMISEMHKEAVNEFISVDKSDDPQQEQQQQLPWYVYVIATDPSSCRSGYATSLLNVIHHLADHDRVNTLLETSGERNMNYYSRPQLGYSKIGAEFRSSDQPKSNPNDEIVIAQSMVRRPKIN